MIRSYYITVLSVSKINLGGNPDERKDFRFVKWLSRNRKLQGIPPSAFYSPEHGDIGENYIRFCFIKVIEIFFLYSIEICNN